MTKDLALIVYGNEMKEADYLTTESFLDAVDGNLQTKLAAQ